MIELQTRAACLTPPGSAAVATVAVIGPNAWPIVRSLFRFSHRRPPVEFPDRSRLLLGEFGPPPGDHVIISARPSTAIPWIEIHSHGGAQVVRWILAELESKGATTAPWTDLVQQSDLSPLQLVAEIELTQAVTPRTAAILLDQFHGALDRALNEIVSLLKSGQLSTGADRLSDLLRYANVGRHLTMPWQVVVTGPPNVGKSSLINRLVGYPRCVVTATAGTTRDLVSTAIAIDGWPVELIDTAGLRNTSDPLELLGGSLARRIARSSDLVLNMREDDEPTAFDSGIQVRNKIDLSPATTRNADVISISALTGEGIDALLSAIAERLAPLAPSPGDAVPFRGGIADEIEIAANRLAVGDVNECMATLNRLLHG